MKKNSLVGRPICKKITTLHHTLLLAVIWRCATSFPSFPAYSQKRRAVPTGFDSPALNRSLAVAAAPCFAIGSDMQPQKIWAKSYDVSSLLSSSELAALPRERSKSLYLSLEQTGQARSSRPAAGQNTYMHYLRYTWLWWPKKIPRSLKNQPSTWRVFFHDKTRFLFIFYSFAAAHALREDLFLLENDLFWTVC